MQYGDSVYTRNEAVKKITLQCENDLLKATCFLNVAVFNTASQNTRGSQRLFFYRSDQKDTRKRRWGE